jgi:drug/metabolite transporter (DMT)-like permease
MPAFLDRMKIFNAESSSARGVALALIVAISFAANSVFAALAYAGGSNPISVLVVRSTAAFAVLYLVLSLGRAGASLPRRQRNTALALGVVMAVSSYGLLAAMEYMPVALCVVTLYTYPLLVALSGWISGHEPFQIGFALALIAAFLGLVIALDLPGTPPSLVGVGLALTAALGVAVLFVVSERVSDVDDSQPFTLHMLSSCMVVSIIASVSLDQFALPNSTSGWIGFIAAPLCYTFAIIFLFVVLAKIGSLKTALLMNLEPVSSVLLGYVILSQALNTLQLLGIALVVAAVISTEMLTPKSDSAIAP